MEYLIEAITNKLRNNSALAGEVGTYSSITKIYHAKAPTGVTYPYIVFHVLPGGEILKTFDDQRADEWPVQVSVFDNDQSSRRAVELVQLIISALDEASLDGLAYTETSPSPEPGARTTTRVIQESPSRIVYDVDSIWHGSVDFRIGLNTA